MVKVPLSASSMRFDNREDWRIGLANYWYWWRVEATAGDNTCTEYSLIPKPAYIAMHACIHSQLYIAFQWSVFPMQHACIRQQTRYRYICTCKHWYNTGYKHYKMIIVLNGNNTIILYSFFARDWITIFPTKFNITHTIWLHTKTSTRNTPIRQ